jgi:hypothetical protein
MKIVCPYTRLQWATELTLRIEEVNTRFVYTGNSDTAYYDLVRELWSQGETFIVVEHDIVIWPGALRVTWECPHPLCVYYAPGPVGVIGLGCVKYGKDLISSFPSHLDNIDPSQRSWRMLDKSLTWDLINKGISFHNHEPMVSHLNPDRYFFEMITKGE